MRIAIFYVMWTGAAIWRREGASGSASSLSSPYGCARPHHIEYCYPHPKNSYFRRQNLLQISKSAIKQSILKVGGAELKQKYCKTNNFEACWRPPARWDDRLEMFSQAVFGEPWVMAVRDKRRWQTHKEEFIRFTCECE